MRNVLTIVIARLADCVTIAVFPVKTGIQLKEHPLKALDPRIRGDDKEKYRCLSRENGNPALKSIH